MKFSLKRNKTKEFIKISSFVHKGFHLALMISRKSEVLELFLENREETIASAKLALSDIGVLTPDISYEELDLILNWANGKKPEVKIVIEYATVPFTYKGFDLISKMSIEHLAGSPFLNMTREEFIQLHCDALDELNFVEDGDDRESIEFKLLQINIGGTEMFLELAPR